MSSENKLILEQLDLSGGADSWFNFWRIYFDWDGEGNTDPGARKKFFEEMIIFYNDLKKELRSYTKPFQVWIQIHEQDSSQDAVFLHTPNPEKDNFPFQLPTLTASDNISSEIKWFINKTGLKLAVVKDLTHTIVYLYDDNVGKALI